MEVGGDRTVRLTEGLRCDSPRPVLLVSDSDASECLGTPTANSVPETFPVGLNPKPRSSCDPTRYWSETTKNQVQKLIFQTIAFMNSLGFVHDQGKMGSWQRKL